MISVVCPALLLIHDQKIKVLLKTVVVFKSRLDVEKTSLVFLFVCFCFEISNKKTNLFITSLKNVKTFVFVSAGNNNSQVEVAFDHISSVKNKRLFQYIIVPKSSS